MTAATSSTLSSLAAASPGSRRRRRWRRAGRRVLVLDARPQLGGRATAFVDRETGELVDNGQHVLFGCYRETFGFLRADRRRWATSIVSQRSRSRTSTTRAARSVLRCPALPSPLHLLARYLRAGTRCRWRDRLTVLRVAGRSRWRRPGASWRAAETSRRRGDTTVSRLAAGSRTGPRMLTRWLWEPLAVAALNQSPDEAAGGSRSCACWPRCSARTASDSSLVLPPKPLHEMYAQPARALHRVSAAARCGRTRWRGS